METESCYLYVSPIGLIRGALWLSVLKCDGVWQLENPKQGMSHGNVVNVVVLVCHCISTHLWAHNGGHISVGTDAVCMTIDINA